jgi:Spy/CpxP family protein refolding chaperone
MDGPEGPDGEEELSEGPRWGGGPGGFGPMPRRLPGEALQAVLGLDDGQVRKLRQIQREKAERLIEAHRQLEQKQASLLDQLEQEEPDGNALVSTVKSIHALRKQAGEIEKEFQAKTAATLNDEQRAKLKAIQEARQIRSALDEAAGFDLAPRAGNGPGGPMRNGPEGPGPDGPDRPVPQR